MSQQPHGNGKELESVFRSGYSVNDVIRQPIEGITGPIPSSIEQLNIDQLQQVRLLLEQPLLVAKQITQHSLKMGGRAFPTISELDAMSASARTSKLRSTRVYNDRLIVLKTKIIPIVKVLINFGEQAIQHTNQVLEIKKEEYIGMAREHREQVTLLEELLGNDYYTRPDVIDNEVYLSTVSLLNELKNEALDNSVLKKGYELLAVEEIEEQEERKEMEERMIAATSFPGTIEEVQVRKRSAERPRISTERTIGRFRILTKLINVLNPQPGQEAPRIDFEKDVLDEFLLASTQALINKALIDKDGDNLESKYKVVKTTLFQHVFDELQKRIKNNEPLLKEELDFLNSLKDFRGETPLDKVIDFRRRLMSWMSEQNYLLEKKKEENKQAETVSGGASIPTLEEELQNRTMTEEDVLEALDLVGKIFPVADMEDAQLAQSDTPTISVGPGVEASQSDAKNIMFKQKEVKSPEEIKLKTEVEEALQAAFNLFMPPGKQLVDSNRQMTYLNDNDGKLFVLGDIVRLYNTHFSRNIVVETIADFSSSNIIDRKNNPFSKIARYNAHIFRVLFSEVVAICYIAKKGSGFNKKFSKYEKDNLKKVILDVIDETKEEILRQESNGNDRRK